MLLPQPKTYTEKVLFALSDAVTAASTDAATKTVTYHRSDAARACLSMAAVMMNAKAENAPQLTPAEIDALLTAGFKSSVSALSRSLPARPLSSHRPGVTTRTLA